MYKKESIEVKIQKFEKRMKRAVVKWSTVIIKLMSFVAGIAAYQDIIPQKYLPYAIALFGLSSLLKDTLISVVDVLDDGKQNKSFTEESVNKSVTKKKNNKKGK